ncbi:MAG: zinc ribbon domain-containing protein [Clostridia bacterium]|nr:zinc ribbon domain-containing protein [Clostridia bacterium]MBR3135750.1 zinc ribbon domain-containing protein [Clostridia bacterium]
MESVGLGGIGMILLVLLVGGGVFAVVRAVVRSVTKVGRLASTVTDIIKKADYEAETTPKSLSSAEPLLLDRIKRDFPEYNPELIRQRVAKDAKTFYESAQAGKCLYVDGISDQLRERLESFLPPDVAGHIQVHKVALAAYDDVSEDRVLTFQAAAAFKDASGVTRQRRLILKYLAAWSTDTETGVRKANCPNCGAPIPAVGAKVCRYCGTALKVWAGIGWLLTDLRED